MNNVHNIDFTAFENDIIHDTAFRLLLDGYDSTDPARITEGGTVRIVCTKWDADFAAITCSTKEAYESYLTKQYLNLVAEVRIMK